MREPVRLLPLNTAYPDTPVTPSVESHANTAAACTSRVHRSWSNYNNNGSHNSVSSCTTMTAREIAARGSKKSLSFIPRCACVHIGKLSKLVFIASARRCLPCVYTESPETQPSLLWARRDATRQRVVRRAYRISRKSEPFNKSGCHVT